jgi:hypothetical protein
LTPPPPLRFSTDDEELPMPTRKRRCMSEPHIDALEYQQEYRAAQEVRHEEQNDIKAVAGRVGAFLRRVDEAAATSAHGICARCLVHGRSLMDALHQSFARQCPFVRQPDGPAVLHHLRGACAFDADRQSRCSADTQDCAVYAACNFKIWLRRDFNACNICWGRKNYLGASHPNGKCQSPTRYIIPTVALMAFKKLRREVAAALPDAEDAVKNQASFLQWAREVYAGPITNGHRLLEYIHTSHA